MKKLVLVNKEDEKQEVYHCLKYWIPLKSGEIYVYAKDDIRIRDKNGIEKKIEEKPEVITYQKADIRTKNVFEKYVLPILTVVAVPLIVAMI